MSGDWCAYSTDAIVDAWLDLLLGDELRFERALLEERRAAETMPAPAMTEVDS